jgi:hypothetical protein
VSVRIPLHYSDTDQLSNAEIEDWYTKDSGGLSGGQIAGIVVSPSFGFW